MWNFQGSWFCGLEISKSCNIHNFTKFSGVELRFAWNLQGYKEKPKKSQGFFQKILSSNPLFVFFWNSPFQNNCFELVLTSLAQKEPLTLCQDSISITFMCSINSIGFRKVHTSVLRYQHIGERSTSTWEVKPPPPPSSPTLPIYIFAVNILLTAGKNPQTYSILKTVLNDIKVKLCCLLHFIRLISSAFSKWEVLRWYTCWASFTDIGSAVLWF